MYLGRLRQEVIMQQSTMQMSASVRMSGLGRGASFLRARRLERNQSLLPAASLEATYRDECSSRVIRPKW